MKISRDPSDGTTWCVRPHGDAEASLVEMLLSALAEKYPDPPPERLLPVSVLERIRNTSNPEVALRVVQRLNLTDDSQANLAVLYEWCRDPEGMSSLETTVNELVDAGVICARFVVVDPRHGYGLEVFDRRADVPSEIEDDNGDLFEVGDADVQMVYVRNAVAFQEG